MIPTRHIANNSTAFSNYWNSKSKYLNSVRSKKLDLNEAEKYVPYYFEVDMLGDSVAQEYLVTHGFSKGMGMLHQIVADYPKNLETYSKTTQTFLKQIFTIPTWLDSDLLDQGTNFCNRTGTSGLATLRNYSLMGGYESSAINKPLIFTEALKKGAVKRLSDTVVFWVNVTSKNQLQLKHKGFYSAITTRLIHSYSRIMILKNPKWDTHAWGMPLNTWDMLATNLGFSIAFIDGLKKLNFKPTDIEIKGTLHVWKYVGYLLGIPEHLLVDTQQQAADALYLWSKTQKEADQDSVALAHSLYTEPKTVTFTNSKWLKNFVYNTNLGYNNEMLGTLSCTKLAIPKTKAIYWIKFIKQITGIVEIITLNSNFFYNKMVSKGYKEQLGVCELYKKEK